MNFVRTLHMVKVGISGLHIILLATCESCDWECRGCRTLLMDVMIYLRVYRESILRFESINWWSLHNLQYFCCESEKYILCRQNLIFMLNLVVRKVSTVSLHNLQYFCCENEKYILCRQNLIFMLNLVARKVSTVSLHNLQYFCCESEKYILCRQNLIFMLNLVVRKVSTVSLRLQL
jgi:hypothetical protein